MKRLLTLAAMFLCCVATTFAQYSGSGSGTENDPYLIFNENQLAQMSNFLDQEGVVFKLMKDLNLTNWIAENNPSQGWLPIGVETSPFKGNFKGNNHKISGLMINRTSTDNVGFFGYVTNATISDLTIEGTSVSGAENVGAMFGNIRASSVTNCQINMTGATGVTGKTPVGGLAGYSKNTNFQTFSVSTKVFGSEGRVGGAIGKADGGGTISNGSFTGNIEGIGNNTAGLVGIAINQTISNVIIKCDINGQNDTGGIAGSGENCSFTDCKYEGDLTGFKYVGGIVGELKTLTSSFTSCFSKGKITATGDYCGGIVGVSQGACIEKMENCSHFGDISAQSYVGGLIGSIVCVDELPTLHTYTIIVKNDNYDDYSYEKQRSEEKIVNGTNVSSSINNCCAVCNIEGEDYVGGLIGSDLSSFGYSSIEKTAAYSISGNFTIYLFQDGNPTGTWRRNGTITYKYYNYARNSISYSLTNNYYNGTINGCNNVGGLIGQKGGGELKNNYAFAQIYGNTYVSGIVGSTTAQTMQSFYSVTSIKSNIENCPVISASQLSVGRIVGSSADNNYTSIGALGSSEGNRALTQTKVILQGVVQEVEDDLQNGTSIGPSLLKLKATYVSMGWNFDDCWNILETESYPYKKYQAAPPIIESELVSQATNISGKSTSGGTIYLYYKDHNAVSTTCSGNNWSFNTEALQSGALVQIYAEVESLTPSYITTSFVGYPGSGTEEDPYRIYTAEDLQGAYNKGYYKLMNDIDLTQWINENSPIEGWPAIGRNTGETTYINGNGHKVTGLWINTTQNFNGLFSNFSAGQIKNLTVEVASGKKVKGGDYTGVLIGRNANGTIENCIVKGDVEGTSHVGGVAGYALNTTANNISYNGTVMSNSADAYVGGLAGMTKTCTITNCHANTTVIAPNTQNRVGGLIGYAQGGTTEKSNVNITLNANGENSYVGGLVGYSSASINQSFSTGSVSSNGENSYTGGLIGYALAPVSNCYSTANVHGTLYSGGLIGYTFSSIDKCYALGNIEGVMYGGGVVGELDGADACLTNSVAANNTLALSAQSSWGCRVIGGYKNGAADPNTSNYALSTMQVSLNNVPQIKTDDLLEGVAKTITELTTKSTYQELDWDFTDIWNISDGTGYPYLIGAIPVIPDDPNPGDDPNPDDPDPIVDPDTDISSMNNVIYLNKVETSANSQINLSIKMKNNVGIRGFQFDIYLPDGVTVVKSAKGKIIGSLSEGRLPEDDEHSLTLSEQGDGAIRFLCGSLYDETFTGNDGEIATLTVKVAEEMNDGDYPIILRNMKLTETDINNYYQTDYVKSTLTIKSYTLGDINNDQKIDVSDYIGIANHILGNTPEGFVFAAADVNLDGNIDVSDYIGVANIILTGSIYGGTSNAAMMNIFEKEETQDVEPE